MDNQDILNNRIKIIKAWMRIESNTHYGIFYSYNPEIANKVTEVGKKTIKELQTKFQKTNN